MLEPTKKHPTKAAVYRIEIPQEADGNAQALLKAVAGVYGGKVVREDSGSTVPAGSLFDFEPGKVLAGLRHREGWTQEELASKIGTNKSAISKMENGDRPISSRTAVRLAQVFNTALSMFGH